MSNQGNRYTLTFVNQSRNNWDFCCFQEDPNIGVPDVKSLAWFAFPVASTTSVSFSWTINYQFIWAQVGRLAPGIIFSATQKWDANLTDKNSVEFTRMPNKAFTFKNQEKGPKEGTLYINQDETIPFDTAAVGINMGIEGAPPGAASGTFAVQGQPNIIASFTPHPSYWCAFGQFKPGEVLDIGQITQKGEIKFPHAIFHMIAILKEDNSWYIRPAPEVNAKFLAEKSNKAHALLV